ncbi:Do family serine endopeptidase [bacterium]|nr:Do family serine endopeptidase [bacterium]
MWSSRQRWSAAGLIFIGVVAGVIFASNFHMTSTGIAGRPAASLPTFDMPAESAPALASVQETGKAFTAISKQLLPTVVYIESTIKGEQSAPERRGDSFRDFFRFFEQPDNQPQRGAGSGVIVSEDGYLLTNHHVIDNAEDIEVTLYDNRVFKATLVGTDPLTEVAVLKIEGEDFPFAALGNSENVEIGEWVLAFGNPLGLTSTVTAGIVSAKSRNINIIRDANAAQTGGSWAIENFIQTDAAINRGNSGGPLVNMMGRVIGLNTAIASGTGFNVGAGFAIPINLARRIMTDLIEKGYVARPWMGISMSPQALSANQAEYYGLDRPTGVFVQEVVEDGPAERAGLRKNDIILELDGKEIDQSNEVQNLVAMKKPGDEVVLKVLRRGEGHKTIQVKLEERRTDEQVASHNDSDDFSELGLSVTELDDEMRRGVRAYRNEEGVIISRVETYGIAFDEGLRRGDLITHIEDRKIESVRSYRSALRSFEKSQVVVFRFKRGDNDLQAFIKLPD